MAIAINGSGTITGISVGGIPDGTVDADALATNAVANAKVADDAVGVAELSATGTASSSTFLRGDNAWAAPAGGMFSSYAKICDKKAYNANGGSFTSGAWRTRDLNHELWDPDGIVSISSNQFTLQAGTYYVTWDAPAFYVARHSSQLYNVTDSSTVQIGQVGYASQHLQDASHHDSVGEARFTISAAKAFEIQHRSTGSYTAGFGVGSNISGVDSIFTTVTIWKEN